MPDYQAQFLIALQTTLQWEGERFINDPADPGGGTKFGISSKQYPKLDIEHLTLADATKIYYEDFWLSNHYIEIDNQSIATKLFDTAVNTGPVASNRFAQQALELYPDGIMGIRSIEAINAAKDAGALLLAIRKEQIKYYVDLVMKTPAEIRFLDGWLNRAISI